MGVASRSTGSDLYQVHRFSVSIISGPFQAIDVASFANVTSPEQNVESLEYSEGIYTYTRVYPGRSSFSTVTMSRGVAKSDTFFAKWIRRASEGKAYRLNLKINQYHRDDIAGLSDFRTAKPSREIICFNCMPTRFRPSSDSEGLSAEISIQEIEFAMERFVVLENGNEARF